MKWIEGGSRRPEDCKHYSRNLTFPTDGEEQTKKKDIYFEQRTWELLIFRTLTLYPTCISTTLDIEHLVSVEEDAEDHRELVEALTQDVLGHGGGDEGRGPAVGFPEQKMLV